MWFLLLRRRHLVTVQVTETLSYLCAHCQFSADAVVNVDGVGTAQTWFFEDPDDVAEQAAERAERNGHKNCIRTIEVATCPQCKRRNAGAIAGQMLWGSLIAVAVGAVFDFVLALFTSDGAPEVFRPAILIPTLALVAFLVWRRYRRIQKADRNVAWNAVSKPKAKPAPEPPRPSPRVQADGDPYRAPHASAPIATIATAKAPAPAPVVEGDPANKPSMLT